MDGLALPVWILENSWSVWSTAFFMRAWASEMKGDDMAEMGELEAVSGREGAG
jgi:hypothetical protein